MFIFIEVYAAIFISVMSDPLNKEEIKFYKTPVSHFLLIFLNAREPDIHYLGVR